MPFTTYNMPPTSSSSLTLQQRRLSHEDAQRLAQTAQRKSTQTSAKDRNLRILLGHAHIRESLCLELALVEQELVSRVAAAQTSTHHTQSSSSSSSSSSSRQVRWADEVPASQASARQQPERSNNVFDSDSDSEEDDGEEDYASLTLVRVPSRRLS